MTTTMQAENLRHLLRITSDPGGFAVLLEPVWRLTASELVDGHLIELSDDTVLALVLTATPNAIPGNPTHAALLTLWRHLDEVSDRAARSALTVVARHGATPEQVAAVEEVLAGQDPSDPHPPGV